MNETKASIMIAMSGGVDSAVAAHLAAKGRCAAGVTMRLAIPNTPHASTAAVDIADAAAICDALGLPHYVADLEAAFFDQVIAHFIKSYEAGLTPNPCIICNKTIKFGALLDFARQNGFEKLATGHYARIEEQNGRMLLRRATDLAKDQSYVLYSLSQEMLRATEFPLGKMSKAAVREMALELGVSVATRRDSQDICFIPDKDYAAFIAAHSNAPVKTGKFITPEGKVLGEHRGIIHYTIGQRKGLGLSLGKPAFVIAKSATDNTVTVGEDAQLYTRRLHVKNINLIPFDTLTAPTKLLAKARYRQEPAAARVEQVAKDELVVEFDTPQRAISPGQALVLYDGDYVVGGGTIA